ncbi:hypothetical protein VN1155_14050 [Helicobacter pylori]|nr:hypothetical protein VN1155_14050 [Helicobacter pylori]
MNSYQKIGMKCDESEIEVAKLKSEIRRLRDENRELVCWIQAQLDTSNSFFKA